MGQAARSLSVGLVALCVLLTTTGAMASGSGRSSAQAATAIVAEPDGCPRTPLGPGATLTAGLGEEQAPTLTVQQDSEAVLRGSLQGPGGGVAGAWVCVYADVLHGYEHALLGIAVTGEDGSFTFAVGPGPSRELTAVCRTEEGGPSATVLLQTSVRPTLKVRSAVVRNKHFARFSGQIPGPGNDGVVVVLQVKRGKGWLVFRRYSSRDDGRFRLRYRFTRTFTPTTYLFRAQVVGGPAYPYAKGSSTPVAVRVRP